MTRYIVAIVLAGTLAAPADAQFLQKPIIQSKPVTPPGTPYVPTPSAKPIVTIPHIETPANLGQPQPQPKPQYKYTPPPYIPPSTYSTPQTDKPDPDKPDSGASQSSAGSLPSEVSPRFQDLMTGRERPPSKPLNEWMVKAEAGDVEAELYVAQRFLNGRVFDTSYPGAFGDTDVLHAIEWYTKAADAGSSQAMATLGMLYENGSLFGIPSDSTVAFNWYKKAADHNATPDMWARTKVCKAYITGHGVQGDINAALPYCGEGEAMLSAWSAAHAYEAGAGRKPDLKEARRLYTLVADLGMPEAMVDLGRLAQNDKDYATALNWYQKAADIHAMAAARPLAVMYEKGSSVKADPMMAAWLYRLSAKWGDDQAIVWVAAHPVSDLEKEINQPLQLNTSDQPPATATFTDSQGQTQTADFGSQFDLMAEYYPPRAKDNEVEGVASFVCRLGADYRLSPCFIDSEFPEGYGFGQSTLKVVLYHDWVFQSKDKDGKDTKGRILHLAVKWQM